MTEEESSTFTTKRRSIGSGGELKWGGEDGEEWSDAVESSENITVTDDGTITSGSEIPDREADQKLVHRWYLSEDTGSFVDQVGSADSTGVTGTSQATGNWVDGAAREGDGTDDHIRTTTWGSFGSNTDTDFSVAYSIQTTVSDGLVMGKNDSGGVYFYVSVGDSFGFGDGNAGEPHIALRDDSGNSLRISADTAVNDGNPHRVVINKVANTGSGAIEAYIDQSQVSTTVHADQGFGTVSDFNNEVDFFARNDRGSPRDHLDGALDDPCIYDNSLTSSEATSYNPPW